MTAIPGLAEGIEQIDRVGGELVLDFSPLERIDTEALEALEKLAGAADRKAAKITLRCVAPKVYKVLKLARLSSRFSFVA